MGLAKRIAKNVARNMGLRMPENRATYGGGMTEAVDMNSETFLEWLGISRKNKGVMGEITYFTCLKMLSETLAKMPIKYYQKTEKGSIEAEPDAMARLLCERPNEYMTPTVFWNAVEMNRNHYGNAYVWIQQKFTRKKYGGTLEPVALWLMPTENVQIIIDDAGIFEGAGRIWYWYTDRYSGKSYFFNTNEVMHFKTSHCIDGIYGMPVQQILRDQVEGNLEAQGYQSSLYRSGMTAKAALEYTGELNSDTMKKLRNVFEEFGAGAKNTGRIMPVPLGFKVVPLDFKLTDAQFFELRKYNALQIGAAFGVKPNQLNDYEKSSYANSEMQQLSFLVDTELYIIKGYEEEINYKCVMPDKAAQGYFYKFNERALLRTDSKTQTEILTAEVDKAIRTPNEARRKVDLPDRPGGDDLLINGAYIPLQLLIEKVTKEIKQQEETGSSGQGREPPDEGQGQQQKGQGKEGEGIEKKAFEL